VGHAHLKKDTNYFEPLLFAILLTGNQRSVHFSEQAKKYDFFDLKGKLEALFTTLGYFGFRLQKSSLPIFHPGRQAKIFLEGVHVGMMGEIHPGQLKAMETNQSVLFAECDLQELLKLKRKKSKMQPLACYPSSERDWTITLSKRVSFDDIMSKINHTRPLILESCSLVSLFEHEKLGADRHNVTLNFVYRDKEKTVSQEEVDLAHNQLVASVAHYLAEKYPD
jgi:phenylalanyl-tRNA synthetase beta chain